MRKLVLVTVATLALAGVLSSSAAAAVEVRNDAGALCSEVLCQVNIDGDSWIKAKSTSTGEVYHHCDAALVMEVSGSGEVLLTEANFTHPYSQGWGCQRSQVMFNDCEDAGAVGQIVAPGDDSYVGSADFQAVFGACFVTIGAYGGAGGYGILRLDIDNASQQEWSIPYPGWASLESGPLFGVYLEGDLDLPSAELTITEIEE